MRILFFIAVVASLLCGCVTTDGGSNGPVVSPTHVSTDEKDDSAPPFNGIVPWWVEEGKGGEQ